MINDVHTIIGTSAPWYEKTLAGLDLGFNVASDVLLLTGVGEAMRGIALGEHVGADLLEHVGEDAIASLRDRNCVLDIFAGERGGISGGRACSISLHRAPTCAFPSFFAALIPWCPFW